MRQLTPYDLFIFGLSCLVLTVLAWDVVAPMSAESRATLAILDWGVCALFLLDFLVSLRRSESKVRYLVTWGWIDLISSVPSISMLRWGRAARALRILRVIRAFRSTRQLLAMILRRRAESAFLAAFLISVLLLAVSSCAMLALERGPEVNIQSAGDAVWWAFVTMTTVGYGDRYPVTGEGRLLAGLLMTAGVGLFGTFTGFVASWFLSPGEKEERQAIDQLREEVAALRDALEHQNHHQEEGVRDHGS